MGRPSIDKSELGEWRQVDRLLGPAHPKGQACVIVTERRPQEYSFTLGFMNGRIFREQKHLPGHRIDELHSLLTDAMEKWLPDGQPEPKPINSPEIVG